MIQNKSPISFSTPVVYPNPTTFGQKFSNFANCSLYLGGRIAYVISPKENIAEVRKESMSFWKTALKISLFVLSAGLIPLVMVIAKAICRRSPKFYQVTKSPKMKPHPHTPSALNHSTDEKKPLKKFATSLIEKFQPPKDEKLKFKFEDKKYLCSKDTHGDTIIQQVNKTLGRGGGAKVTELIDTSAQKRTALKVATSKKLPKEAVYDSAKVEEAEKDLKYEVETLNFLNAKESTIGIQKSPLSPVFKITKTYPSRSKTRHAIEEEVYDGSLDKLEVSTIKDLNVQLSIIYQIAKGVQYFRDKGIVHSDIKPANIFYKNDGNGYRVDIGDFGSSWKKGQFRGLAVTPKYSNASDVSQITNSITEAGQFLSGKKLDIYCLGTTFKELLFGPVTRLRRTVKNRLEERMKKRKIDPKSINTFFVTLERMVMNDSHSFFERLTSKENKRPSIQEVVDAIAVVYEETLPKGIQTSKVYSTIPN